MATPARCVDHLGWARESLAGIAEFGNVVDAGLAKRQTASFDLKRLRKIGVLKEIKVDREKPFLNPVFLELLAQ